MKSIRTKILVVGISGLLILGLTLSLIVLYATNEILHKNADTIMSFEGEKEAAKINDMLGDVEKSINIVAEAAESQLYSLESLKDIKYQQAYTRDMEMLFNNAARNTEGMVAYYFRYNPDLDLPDVGFFYGLDLQTGWLQKFPVTDLSGNRENIRWWNEPTTAQKAVWISPYYHNNSDFLMVSYVAPIYQDNQLVGVAGIDIQLSRLLSAVGEISPYENGYAYLLSDAGQEPYYPYGTVLANADEEIATSSAPLNNGMSLVVCAYYRDILWQGRQMAAAIVVASICVVGLFIVLTVIMSQKITKPLRRLALSARNIGKGMELEELAGEKHKDEIGVLCRVVYNSNKQLNEYMNEIKSRAYRDALTGLKNRAAYNEAQRDIERRIAEGETEFGALVLDINNMKTVNDTYGHVYGNMLLARVAKIITAAFHRSAVYRIGGDEFVVLLEGVDYDIREDLLARFDKMCAEECLEIGDDKIPISIARGLAIYDSRLDSSYDNVFHRADGAMYRHKRESKGL